MERIEAGRRICEFLSGRPIPETRLAELSPADWEDLADWALRLNMGGLFYREMKSRDLLSTRIPAGGQTRLRNAYRNQALVNTSRFSDAAKALHAFADHQLPVMALKGLALAQRLYGDIALRPMCDIDLLMKEEDLVRAGRILLSLGYQPFSPDWESHWKLQHHLPPFTNSSGTTIELHRDLVIRDSPIHVDHSGLWERARTIQIGPAEALALSPEDLLMHLCAHACHHLETGVGLRPFCDLARLIQSSADPVDWKIVRERAAQWRVQRCVYLMLLLVQDLLAAAPPEPVLSEMKPEDYQPAFLDTALEQVLGLSRSDQLIGMRIGIPRIKEIKGIKGKAWSFFREVFPTREKMASKFPVSASSPKVYLWYVVRLYRLGVFYAKAFGGLFRRDPAVVRAFHQSHRVAAVAHWMFSK